MTKREKIDAIIKRVSRSLWDQVEEKPSAREEDHYGYTPNTFIGHPPTDRDWAIQPIVFNNTLTTEGVNFINNFTNNNEEED
jgi:hypothetical protein